MGTARSRFALAGHFLHSLSLSFLPARKTITTSFIFLFRSLGFLGKPLRRQQRLPSSVLIKKRAASSTSSISTTTQAGRKRRDMPAAHTTAVAPTAATKRPFVATTVGQMEETNDASARLQVKKLSEHAKIPVRGSAGAAGYDLYSAKDCVIPARGKGLVPTDISIAIPYGTYARIAPRSGLAWKNSIDTGGVDYDYRGPVGVILFNHSDNDFVVNKGDRVAQMVLERIVTPEIEEVLELSDTTRGAGGFGS